MGMSRPRRRSKRLPVPSIGRGPKRLSIPLTGRRSKRLPIPLTGRRSKRLPLPAIGRPSWKLVGLAGLAGVAATGVVVARNRRAHRDLPPDELRRRLRERLAAVDAQVEPAAPEGPPAAGPQPPGTAH